jgi:RHS repeat-associated protein
LYALQDPNWNVTAVTDSIGTISERYQYTAYGVRGVLGAAFGSISATAYDWSYAFTGRPLDSATGLLDYRRRPYDAGLGRFSGTDPLEIEPNLYCYCGNRPLDHLDPSGEGFWDWVPFVGTVINCFSTPAGSSAGDYSGCKPKCNDDAGKLQCKNCIISKALGYIVSYVIGAVPGPGVDLIGGSILVGGKTLIRGVAGGFLLVDGIISAACTVSNAIGIGNAAGAAMDTLCK